MLSKSVRKTLRKSGGNLPPLPNSPKAIKINAPKANNNWNNAAYMAPPVANSPIANNKMNTPKANDTPSRVRRSVRLQRKSNDKPSPKELEDCQEAFENVLIDKIEHRFYSSKDSKLVAPGDYRSFLQRQREIVESLSRDECIFLKILCQEVYAKKLGYVESHGYRDSTKVGLVFFDINKNLVIAKKDDVSQRYASIFS